MKRIILCLGILFASANVKAQSVTIETEVVHPTNSVYKAVVAQNTIHAIIGSKVTYKMTVLNLDSVENVVSCQYTYNNDAPVNANFVLDKGVLTINDVSFENLTTNTTPNKFSISLVVKEKGKEENTTLPVAEAIGVRLYDEPSCSLAKEPDRFVYMTEKSGTSEWEMTANGGGNWSYNWSSTSGQKGQQKTFSIGEINSVGETVISVSADNVAPDNATVWAHYEKKWTFIIYAEAKVQGVEPNSAENPLQLFQNQIWPIEAKSVSGFPGGWTYEWRDVDSGVDLGHDAAFVYSNPVADAVVNRHVELTVKNVAEIGQGQTEEWFNQRYNFYANFYPQPLIAFDSSYPQNVIDGDPVTMSLTIKNPQGISIIDDSNYNWTYKWIDGNKSGNDKTYNYIAENSSNNDGVRGLVTLIVSGKLKGGNGSPCTEQKISHTYMVWPKPTVSPDLISKGNPAECGGRTLDLQVNKSGGQKTGWTYEWFKDGQSIVGETGIKLEKIFERASTSDVITEKYSVRVRNICENTVRKDVTLNYSVQVYPEPWTPNDVVIIDENRKVAPSDAIREGNKISLSCDVCYGGYPGAWTYEWFQNGNLVSTAHNSEITIPVSYSGESKQNSKTVDLMCVVKNAYATIYWENKPYTKTYTIYKKPKTPLSIVKKGNGTSGTVVATTSLSDTDLQDCEYYLVFGYIDASGNMHDLTSVQQLNPGEVRWSKQLSSAIVNDNNNTIYVYALWKYDNVEITSGLRTVNSVDEEWDGSDYSGNTRWVIWEMTGIKDVNLDNVTSSAISKVYSLDGRMNNHLNKGINIVRVGDAAIKKVVIKK